MYTIGSIYVTWTQYIVVYIGSEYNMLLGVTLTHVNVYQKPEHSTCFAWGMFGYSRLVLVDNSVDNLPCITIFVLIVHTVHNRLILFDISWCIYSLNAYFANRYGLVK